MHHTCFGVRPTIPSRGRRSPPSQPPPSQQDPGWPRPAAAGDEPWTRGGSSRGSGSCPEANSGGTPGTERRNFPFTCKKKLRSPRNVHLSIVEGYFEQPVVFSLNRRYGGGGDLRRGGLVGRIFIVLSHLCKSGAAAERAPGSGCGGAGGCAGNGEGIRGRSWRLFCSCEASAGGGICP